MLIRTRRTSPQLHEPPYHRVLPDFSPKIPPSGLSPGTGVNRRIILDCFLLSCQVRKGKITSRKSKLFFSHFREPPVTQRERGNTMKQEYFRMQTRPVIFNIKMFYGWTDVMIRNITVPLCSFLYTCRTPVCPSSRPSPRPTPFPGGVSDGHGRMSSLLSGALSGLSRC